MKRYPIIIVVVAAVFILVATFSVKANTRTQFKMGTFVKITLRAPFWYDFDGAFDAAFSAIDNVDSIADIYDENSEISRLNKSACDKEIKVSDDLFLVIQDSIELSRISEGEFDITVGPLVKLWRPYKGRDLIPSQKGVKRALFLVGYDNIVLDEDRKTVFFEKRGMSLDLSAIAKGYAVDKAVEAIKDQGFNSAIVNAGGDLYCLGKKSFLSDWRIGIRDPVRKDDIMNVLYIADKAVATSGGHEQYFTYKGKDYTHLIHPKTGYPLENIFSAVTVITTKCILADGIATAVCVGGEDVKRRVEGFYPNTTILIKD